MATTSPSARRRTKTRAGSSQPKGKHPDTAAAAPTWHIDPEALSALQAEFMQRFQAQLNQQMSGAAPELGNDRRFAAEAWQKQPLFGWQAAWYRFHSEFLQRSVALVQSDERTQDRLRFAVQQWIDAVSPANFLATNPDAQQRMIETQGESLRQGIQNLLNDLQQGRISQTPADAFEVGRNVCTTPGTVIYQNELVQLIQSRETD